MTNNWTLCGLCKMLPYKALLFATIVLCESLRLSVPILTGILVDALTETSNVSLGVWGSSALLLTLECTLLCVTYLKEVLEARTFATFDRNVFSAYWESVVKLDVDAFVQIPIGTWMGKLSYDVKTVSSSMRQSFGTIVGFGTFWVWSVLIMAWKNEAAMCLILVSVLIGGIVCLAFMRRVRIASEKMRKSAYSFSETLYGLVKCYPLLSIHGAVSRYLPLIRKSSAMATGREMVLSVITAQNRMAMGVASWIVRGGVVLVCVNFVMQGRCTIGEMVALIVLVGQLLQGVASIVQVIPSVQTGMEALCEMRNTVLKVGRNQISHDGNGLTQNKSVQNGELVVCDKVSFAYPNGREIFRELSLVLRRGDFCVFIGRNGTGKSTLAKLILKVLKPTQGEVVTDKIKVGWIPQDMEMRGENILEAIRLKDQTISETAIKQEIHKCGLDDWIKSLSRGIYSHVSAESISGGQLQLLSIARALVRDPDLLVVDEVSNNLDIVMKQKIYKVLHECSKGRTVILVSHDIESIRLANRLFFFGEKGITELPKGTSVHEVVELLSEKSK